MVPNADAQCPVGTPRVVGRWVYVDDHPSIGECVKAISRGRNCSTAPIAATATIALPNEVESESVIVESCGYWDGTCTLYVGLKRVVSNNGAVEPRKPVRMFAAPVRNTGLPLPVRRP